MSFLGHCHQSVHSQDRAGTKVLGKRGSVVNGILRDAEIRLWFVTRAKGGEKHSLTPQKAKNLSVPTGKADSPLFLQHDLECSAKPNPIYFTFSPAEQKFPGLSDPLEKPASENIPWACGVILNNLELFLMIAQVIVMIAQASDHFLNTSDFR